MENFMTSLITIITVLFAVLSVISLAYAIIAFVNNDAESERMFPIVLKYMAVCFSIALVGAIGYLAVI